MFTIFTYGDQTSAAYYRMLRAFGKNVEVLNPSMPTDLIDKYNIRNFPACITEDNQVIYAEEMQEFVIKNTRR